MRLDKSWAATVGRDIPGWQQYVPLALGIMTLVGLILFPSDLGNDDPYITYRYASNLLAGNGAVYNVGERTLSTTAPLYALLLAGLGLVWPNLPVLSNALSALALVLGAVLLFAWANGQRRPAVGMVAALLLSLSPSILATFGAETCLYMMLVLAALLAYDRSRLGVAAAALALAAMIRPDGVLAAIAVGLCHLVRHRAVQWRPVLLYVGLVAVWYGGLWLYYGSPVPVTLLAKQKQGLMTASARFEVGFLNLASSRARQPLFWLHGILALVGLWQVLVRARYWLPLMVWTVLYFLAYTLLRVSSYPWYYAPLVPAFAVLVAEGTVTVARWLARTRLPRALIIGLIGLLLIAIIAPLIGGVIWASWQPDPRLPVYREIGEWLEAHTPSQASVGALEVGIIGYYGQRHIVDFAGLIQPKVARQIRSTDSFLDTATWTIQTYQPDYVLLHQPDFSRLSQSNWFQQIYLPVRDFTNHETLWLTLYHRSESP